MGQMVLCMLSYGLFATSKSDFGIAYGSFHACDFGFELLILLFHEQQLFCHLYSLIF